MADVRNVVKHIAEKFLSRFVNSHMWYTYILQSLSQPGAIYIGYTRDLRKRLGQHNSSRSDSQTTRRYQPWSIETYVGFSEEISAKEFERYLKSNSGKAFLRKRLISKQFRDALAKFNNGRSGKVSDV